MPTERKFDVNENYASFDWKYTDWETDEVIKKRNLTAMKNGVAMMFSVEYENALMPDLYSHEHITLNREQVIALYRFLGDFLINSEE